MTHIITDGWGQQMYCDVCSHSWIVSVNPTWQTRQQMGVRVGSTGD